MDLRLEGVSHRYDGVPVLEDVSFAVASGEILCVVGPSGCGKSTLLRLIGGLERATAGRILQSGAPPAVLYVIGAAYGGLSFTVYSLCIAHTNDFADPDFIVELSAALIFFFSLGAIVSPLISAWLIALAGANAMFVFMAVVHLALVAFTLFRMTRRQSAEPREPYQYLPRTSMILARLRRTANGGDRT